MPKACPRFEMSEHYALILATMPYSRQVIVRTQHSRTTDLRQAHRAAWFVRCARRAMGSEGMVSSTTRNLTGVGGCRGKHGRSKGQDNRGRDRGRGALSGRSGSCWSCVVSCLSARGGQWSRVQMSAARRADGMPNARRGSGRVRHERVREDSLLLTAV
jgi:hypothetical protein